MDVAEYNKEYYMKNKIPEDSIREDICFQIMDSLKFSKMLDLGSSDCRFSAPYADRADVHAVEIVPEMVKICRSMGVKAVHSSLSKRLPYQSNSFDLVFAGEVIEHVQDSDLFLREIFRILRPGGHMLLTTPNLLSLRNRLHMIFGKSPKYYSAPISKEGHVRIYTPETLKAHAKKAGFRIVQLRGDYVMIPLLQRLIKPPGNTSMCERLILLAAKGRR